MNNLTLKQAKELSQKKWEYVVDNNGSEYKLSTKIPEIKTFPNKCAMCQYCLIVNNITCSKCIYHGICWDLYSNWLFNKTKERAEDILNAIKKRNKNKKSKI